MPNFEGISAKIKRAANHASSLEADMDRFCIDIRTSIVQEVHEDAEEQAWVFRGETPNVPLDWSVRLGEILYLLRSALDHLVWQLVLANGQEPGPHNAFPIVRNEAAWSRQARSKLRGVSQADANTIRRLQPIDGGIGLPFDVFGLSRLNSLCNVDKHRHLILAIVGLYGFRNRHNQPRFGGSSSGRPLQGSSRLGKIEKGSVVLCLNDAGRNFEPDFQINIRFKDMGDAEVTAGTVPNILGECLTAVRGSIRLLTRRGPSGSVH